MNEVSPESVQGGKAPVSKPGLATRSPLQEGGEVGVGVAVGLAVGVAVAVGLAVGVAVGVGLAVGVGVGVGVGDGVGTPPGPSIRTPRGAPVLKKPTVPFVGFGGWSASKRKLYSVPQRIALAFWLVANVSVLHVIEPEFWLTFQGVPLYP